VKGTTANEANCARFIQIQEDLFKEKDAQFKAQYPGLLEYLQTNSGLDADDLEIVDPIASASKTEVCTIKVIAYYLQKLNVKRVHNMPQPAWLDAIWKNTSMSVYQILTSVNAKTTVGENTSQQSNRLLSGVLMNDILQRTTRAANGSVTAPGTKMTMYSAVCEHFE
jgi:hypothetical protein